MGRAIVREAEAFLFDEPLSNLDAKLRGQMRTEILRMQRRLGITTVYVTHDQTEAMTLGDRVALLRKGELQQVATPRELYEHPVNLFVAGFIGSPPMNFVPGARRRRPRCELPFVTFDAPRATCARPSATASIVMVGIRPERFEDAERGRRRQGRRGGVTFDAHVDVIEWLGNEQYAYIPYETRPTSMAEALDELERDLDSERMRSQLVVALDPASRIATARRRRSGSTRAACTSSTRRPGDEPDRTARADRRGPDRSAEPATSRLTVGRARPSRLRVDRHRSCCAPAVAREPARPSGTRRRSPFRDIPVGPEPPPGPLRRGRRTRCGRSRRCPAGSPLREYEVLRELEVRALPAVRAAGVVIQPIEDDGRPRHRTTSSGRGSTGAC